MSWFRRKRAFADQATLDRSWEKIKAERRRQDAEAKRLKIGPYKQLPTVVYEEEKPKVAPWRKRA